MMLYFVGLLIMSLAIGHEYSSFHGWMCLGIGIIIGSIIDYKGY